MTASHVKIGFLALCIALLLGVPAALLSGAHDRTQKETTVAVEHSAPAAMRVARLASSGTNIYEITFTGSGTMAVHLPSSWKRTEVRGAPIASMVAEPQQWDYVRWTMPSDATARFETPNPGRVTLLNPSGIPLTVTAVRVDVERRERQEDAMIVTDDPFVLP